MASADLHPGIDLREGFSLQFLEAGECYANIGAEGYAASAEMHTGADFRVLRRKR